MILPQNPGIGSFKVKQSLHCKAESPGKPELLQCVDPESGDILLENHMQLSASAHLTWMQYFNLIYCLFPFCQLM